MVEIGANFAVFLFSEAPCNENLNAGPKTKAQHEKRNVEKAGNSRSPEFNFTQTPEEGSIRNIDNILGHESQNNRIRNLPDLPVFGKCRHKNQRVILNSSQSGPTLNFCRKSRSPAWESVTQTIPSCRSVVSLTDKPLKSTIPESPA